MSEQQQQQDQQQRQNEVIAAVAAALLVFGPGVLTGASLVSLATTLASMLGVSTATALEVLRLAGSQPVIVPAPTPAPGGALAQVQRDEYLYRAAFIEASTRRVERAVTAGKSAQQAVVGERRFYLLHVESQRKRSVAAVAVDREAKRRKSKTLGWYAVLDSRTSPECRAANGANFEVGERPVIGYPGSVHPHCRCKPGPPHRGARDVDTVTAAYVKRVA